MFTILIMLALPLMIMAQGVGGEIRRPVRTNTNNNTRPSRPSNNTFPSTNSVNNQRSTNSVQSAILQKLINNMVYVEGGFFLMGSNSKYSSDESPVHQVKISSFSIGKYEVTQEEWVEVMGSNPSKFKGSKKPVEQVTWRECQAFIQKLNELTGRTFRLPTEAEWEYAARGGSHSSNNKYSGSNALGLVAWYSDNSNGTTHEVGANNSNELGLYDMNGNVWEWCQDYYGRDYYSNSSYMDPQGPTNGISHVYRGGGFKNNINFCNMSIRNSSSAVQRFEDVGLRLALDYDQTLSSTKDDAIQDSSNSGLIVPSIIIETYLHKWEVVSVKCLHNQTVVRKKVTPISAQTTIYSDRIEFIEDSDTGKKYYITDSEIGFTEYQKVLSDTSDYYFYEYYPALPMNVKRINISSGSNYYVKNFSIR